MERFLNSLTQQQEDAGGTGRPAGGQAGASRQDLGWVARVLFVLLQSPLNSETASYGSKLLMRIRWAGLAICVVIHLPPCLCLFWLVVKRQTVQLSHLSSVVMPVCCPPALAAASWQRPCQPRSGCLCGRPCKRC